MSRADFWVLAGMAAVEETVKYNNQECSICETPIVGLNN